MTTTSGSFINLPPSVTDRQTDRQTYGSSSACPFPSINLPHKNCSIIQHWHNAPSNIFSSHQWMETYPYKYVTHYPNWHVYSLLSKCRNGRPFHRSPSHKKHTFTYNYVFLLKFSQSFTYLPYECDIRALFPGGNSFFNLLSKASRLLPNGHRG